MPLAAGQQLGPYEVLAPLGAGGMGEVYRARDPRLAREVALKILPAAVSSDPDRLRRFELEAKASGALNHPGILAVFDVGEHDGIRYVASELLVGETLRERLGAGGFPLRKALDYAMQVAHGLAAAHDKGIVHRDLKPENLFVTSDGRAKILDFGLAKVVASEHESAGAETPTRTHDATDAGVVMGTAGYMSPEQVRGLAADRRSDIFAFGSVLYELLGRRRAFRGETAAETMTAILREEPPPLDRLDPTLPPALDRIVRRCLEKRPEERFQSARDVAFALEALSSVSMRPAAGLGAETRARQRVLLGIGLALFVLALAVAGALAARRWWPTEPLRYTQLTFRRGTVYSAHFAADGQTILYSAAWEGRPPELFSTRPESPESRSLGITNASLLSISSAEMALALDPRYQAMVLVGGSLARVALSGGAPRVVLEDVAGADWSPDGTHLAVVRQVDGKWRLEFPPGKVLYESESFLAFPAVSPDNGLVAFAEFSARDPSVTTIGVVDPSGRKRMLTGDVAVANRLVWAPGGAELWFRSEGGARGSSSLHAVTPSGRMRLITRLHGVVNLHDVFRDGRALISWLTGRASIFARAPGTEHEADLSWLDASNLADISADGRTLVFTETMSGGGRGYGVYLRRTDGSEAVRLGDGRAHALSPDGKWVLTVVKGARPRIVLLPTGAGEPREIPNEVVTDFRGGSFFPDSLRLVFAGHSPADGVRLFMAGLHGGQPQPIGPVGLGLEFPIVSPDGRAVAAANAEGELLVVPVDGSAPAIVEGAEAGELPIQWSADSRSLYVYRPDEIPARVYKVDVNGDGRRLFREIAVPDPTGLEGRMTVVMTPDGAAYAYSVMRWLSELYLVEGLR